MAQPDDGTTTGWTDSHCHLDDDAEASVAEALAAGVVRLVDVGTTLADSRRAIERAHRFGSVLATAGIHPHDAKDGLEGLAELVGDERVVAVGECGLDYHYDHSSRDVQREVFASQIQLARQAEKPVVIHTREAWDDTFDIARAEGLPEGSIFHCFTGGPTEARRCLELGAVLSFSGIVTFKGAPEVRDAALMCPSGSLLVETDAPFLAPVPHRGRPNRPALVAVVGAFVAALRGVDAGLLAAETSATAARVFGLDPLR